MTMKAIVFLAAIIVPVTAYAQEPARTPTAFDYMHQIASNLMRENATLASQLAVANARINDLNAQMIEKTKSKHLPLNSPPDNRAKP